MAHADFGVAQANLHVGGQLEQAQVVGHGRAVFAHPVAQLFLAQVALAQQALVAEGDFDGIQVLSLNVLNQGHFQHLLVVGLADVGRNGFQTRQPGGLQAPLPADELVGVGAELAQGHGLDDALNLNALGQFVQGLLVEMGAGLVGVGLDVLDRNEAHRVDGVRHQPVAGAGPLAFLVVAALNQGVQAPAQAPFAFHRRGGGQGSLQFLFVSL